MRLKDFLWVAALTAGPVAAWAQPFDGVYIGGGAGYNGLQSPSFKNPPAPPFGSAAAARHLTTFPNRIDADAGFVGLGSVGYGFGNGVRIEAEGSYRQNDVAHLSGTSFPTKGSGTDRTWAAMFNVLFDMDIGSPWVYPYLGAGAGAAWTNLDKLRANGTNYPASIGVNDTHTNFAYQAIAGLSFPVYGVPGLSLTTEYRFFGQVGQASFKYAEVQSGVASSGRVKLGEQFNHAALLGIRYAFDVTPPPPPAPAPVAAPAPQAARSYLVFFDWDRADLTSRARQIVAEAAQNSTRVEHTRIEVNGYTDTSGSPAYNQRLSVRRAQAVAAELVKDGVPRDVISIQGFGETNLLVPTAQGVREPQNRRVEIIIR